MIQHQDHKLIYNGQVSFELPNGICFDFDSPDCLCEDGFQLIAPDESFTILMAFLTVDKSAKRFTEEIFEERDDIRTIEPIHEIETESGIKGYATTIAYTNEVVEEIALDLPGEHHALLNVSFWRLNKPYDERLYNQAKADILRAIEAV